MVATPSTREHHAPLTEAELIRAHSAGAAHEHIPQPHELRNAWESAKQLEERLELANQPVLRRIARYLREQTFLALMELEGFVEVASDG
jgi:hypothetical protein